MSPDAEACGCDQCLNFAAQRDTIYPPELLQLFDALGLDHRFEADVNHLAQKGEGSHIYGVAFHFVGRLMRGKDGGVRSDSGGWSLQVEPMSEGVSLAFSARTL